MANVKRKTYLYLIFSIIALLSSAMAESDWLKQQENSRKQAENFLQKYPNVTSERFVFKTITLPDGQQLELDMHIERPKEPGAFPVVFFVHGGGWITGSKGHFCHQSFELAKHGIAGVRMEYRLMQHGGIYSNVIGDVLDAIDFVRKRKGELKLDFTRVGLAGGSAGGHLSAIAAQLTPECICFDGFNGLYDILNPDSSAFHGREDFVGRSIEEKKKASAIYLLKEKPVDTLLYHGSEDITIDIKQSYRLAKAISEKGGSAGVLEYEGVGHSFFEKEPYLSVTTQAMLAHVKHAFGMTDEKPDLLRYALPPHISPAPDGFTPVGKWHKEGQTHQKLEFKADFSMNYGSQSLSWDERYGSFHVIWKGDTKSRIEVLEWNRIKLSKDTYLRDSRVPSVFATQPDLSVAWRSKRYQAIQHALENAEAITQADVIFVGDSITQGWQEQGLAQWKKSFAGQPWKGLNLGVAGDRTENLLYRLQPQADGGAGHMDDPTMRPKVIVLMIGTNNLFVHQPEQIMAGVLSCKNQLQRKQPQARIILCSLLPVKEQTMNENLVKPVNRLLEKMHAPPSLHWLDLYPHFLADDGTQKTEFFQDQLHLNATGYQQWHDFLVPVISKIDKLQK